MLLLLSGQHRLGYSLSSCCCLSTGIITVGARWLAVVLVFVGLLAAAPSAVAQTLTVRELLEQQDQWPTWAQKKMVLHINGRFGGRAARQFRLEKLPVLMSPGRATALSRSPDAGQRMTVSGILLKQDSQFTMNVSRIAVGSTDSNRLTALVEKSGDDHPEEWYELATEYADIADFYDDQQLQQQVTELRRKAFNRQHQLFRNNWQKLAGLAQFGADIKVDSTVLQALRFESIVLQSRDRNSDRDGLYTAIRQHLPGWNRQPNAAESDTEPPLVSLSPQLQQEFAKDSISTYASAEPELQKAMHRLLYRQLRAPEISAELKADGSNGLEVADRLKSELPEETELMKNAQQRYVDYRLTRIPQLTRRQLEELTTLLQQFDRRDDVLSAVEEWLKAQNKRRNNAQLDGYVATAEEYLYAFERWKQPAHRDTGTDLLKKAWREANQAAPQEAKAIAQRLEQLGWTRLRERWMTTAEIDALPKNDVALAMREGRVVKGMKAPQIVNTLGRPTRTVRVISARRIQEIWVYGEAGSSAITVHVERGRSQSPDQAVATLVTTVAQ